MRATAQNRSRVFRGAAAGLVFAVFVAAYVFSIGVASQAQDFEIQLNHYPVVVLPRPMPFSVHGRFEPDRLRSRLAATVSGYWAPVSWSVDDDAAMVTSVPPLDTGLHMLRFGSSYMGGRVRETALPVVVGPFSQGDEWLTRAAAIYVSQALLWDGTGSSRDLSSALTDVLEAKIYEEIPEEYEHLLTGIVTKELRLEIVEDGVRTTIEVALNGDSTVAATGKIHFTVDHRHNLHLENGGFEVAVDLQGDLLRRIRRDVSDDMAATGAAIGSVFPIVGTVAGYIGGALIGERVAEGAAEKRLKREVHRIIDEEVLPYLSQSLKFGKPISISDQLDTRFKLRWSSSPVLQSGEGVWLRLDVQPQVDSGHRRGSVVPGAPLTWRHSPEVRTGHRASVSISEDVVNVLLHQLWADGTIDGKIGDQGVVASVNETVEKLTISVNGLRADLPPVFSANSAGLKTIVGASLTDHGTQFQSLVSFDAAISAEWQANTAKVSLVPREFYLSCLEGSRLFSCYPDLVNTVKRESLVNEGLTFDISNQIRKLSDVELFSEEQQAVRMSTSGAEFKFGSGGLRVEIDPVLYAR